MRWAKSGRPKLPESTSAARMATTSAERRDRTKVMVRAPSAMKEAIISAASVVAGAVWAARARERSRPVVEALAEVDAAWRVRTLSDALREASDLLGRSYLRTAAAVWDLALLRKLRCV